jgi:hypothetical protein
MKRIVRLMAVMAAVLLGFLWYAHWSRSRAMNSGEVRVRQEPGDTTKPGSSESSQANQSQETAANQADTSSGDQSHLEPRNSVITLPAVQTISRNPPNGLVVAGTGKFQLYRQGDITWRMNTETGEACVLFATEAMWRRSLVYEHGCGSH